MKNAFGQRLKELRIAKGLSQEELGNLANTTRQTISNYEIGKRNADYDMLDTLSDIFNVDIDYLLGKTLKTTVIPHSLKNHSVAYKRIKVYGSVPAGIPIEAIEDIDDFEDISFKEFDFNKEYIGLKVKGDSMYPKYLDGDIIIIELAPCCESGVDAVVYVNGFDATLKTFIKNSDGTITLKPLNPNYAPMTYGINDDPVQVLGIVKQIRRNI